MVATYPFLLPAVGVHCGWWCLIWQWYRIAVVVPSVEVVVPMVEMVFLVLVEVVVVVVYKKWCKLW